MSEDESTRGERCPDCGGLYALVGHSRGIRWSLLGRSLCGAIASIRRAGPTALEAGTGPRNGRMAGSGSAGRNTPSRLNNALLQLKRLLNSEITPPTCARTVMSAAGGSCHRGVRTISSDAPFVDVRSPTRPRICADLEKFVLWKSSSDELTAHVDGLGRVTQCSVSRSAPGHSICEASRAFRRRSQATGCYIRYGALAWTFWPPIWTFGRQYRRSAFVTPDNGRR